MSDQGESVMKTLTLRNAIASLLGFAIGIAILPAFAADREAWFGTWEGQWSQGFLDTTLIVEKIEDGKASVIYKWGTSQTWRISEPGEMKVEGEFTENGKTLVVKLPAFSGVGIWATVTYAINDDGTLNAKFSNRHGNFYATMKKK